MITAVVIGSLSSATANSIKDNKQQLNHVKHSIANVKAQLSKQQQLRESNEKKLKKTELMISKIVNELTNTRKKLELEKKNLKNFQNQEKHYQERIDKQKTSIAQQIRAAYMLPDTYFLKLLLDSNQSQDISRIRTYYYYLTQNQLNKIQALKNNIDKLQHYQKKSYQQSRLLSTLKQKQQKQHQQLKRLKSSRETIVKQINSKILTKQQHLSLLTQQEHQLEKTIFRLQKVNTTGKSGYFGHLRGKLLWPVKGNLITHYGESINQSELTANGVLIQAEPGESVHVIANGKVIFANWLSGYGLLLIVEHGDGYISVYGRNQNLYKQLGDTVKQGEVISRVGQSGGYKKPELYFAIRHNATPKNPSIWCTRK